MEDCNTGHTSDRTATREYREDEGSRTGKRRQEHLSSYGVL